MLVKDILKKCHLRNTAIRREILKLFIDTESALSLQKISDSLEGNFDRTTIYRTLKSFMEKGIVHQVQDSETKYIFSEETSPINHAHFKCNNCGDLICLTELNIKKPELPNGYVLENINLLVSGTCKDCTTAN